MKLTTKPPIKFFVFITLSIFFTVYLIVEGMVVMGALFYGTGSLFIYWISSNKDCRITLTETTLEINFYRTFWKKNIYQLNEITRVDFIKAYPFWKLFFINNSIERYYRSQDKLIIDHNLSQKEVMINADFTDLQMIVSEINNRKRNSIEPRPEIVSVL
jgi:hypothetical protein